MSLEPLLDKIPLWLALSLALSAAILASIPKVLDVWQKANAYNRWYERKKRRLELLKLHYDIEALKKEKDLATLPGDSENLRLELENVQQPVEDISIIFRNLGTQFTYGATGGIFGLFIMLLLFILVPELRGFASSPNPSQNPNQITVLEFAVHLVGIVFNSGTLGFIAAFFLPQKFVNGINSFAAGALIIVFVLALSIVII